MLALVEKQEAFVICFASLWNLRDYLFKYSDIKRDGSFYGFTLLDCLQFGSKMVKINKKRIDFVCDVEKIRKADALRSCV